jgi:hypothetical protein
LARLKTRLAILGDAGTISAKKLRKTKALKRANKLKILVLVTFQLSSKYFHDLITLNVKNHLTLIC